MTGDCRPTNPERDQDRAADLAETWAKYGYVMFPQQRAIYQHLSRRCAYRTVLEAGCGDGIGGATVAQRAKTYVGTDKLPSNVEFARCLHPWLTFTTWNVAAPWHGEKAEAVVAVECIEHVADPGRALRHLLDAATHEVWLSTPNGAVKREYPPSNPFHTVELTPAEVLLLLPRSAEATIYEWEHFRPVTLDTEANPLVYRIRKGG